jgi:hypothetical protein
MLAGISFEKPGEERLHRRLDAGEEEGFWKFHG